MTPWGTCGFSGSMNDLNKMQRAVVGVLLIQIIFFIVSFLALNVIHSLPNKSLPVDVQVVEMEDYRGFLIRLGLIGVVLGFFGLTIGFFSKRRIVRLTGLMIMTTTIVLVFIQYLRAHA